MTSDDIQELTSTQLNVMTEAQISAITPVTDLAATQLAAMTSAAIQKLTSAQLRGLTNTQFDALTSANLGGIETSDFAGLNSSQLNQLTSHEIRFLGGGLNVQTSAQIESLLISAGVITNANTSAQIAALAGVTPMVLDLDGNGIQTVNVQNGVTFDIDNDGKVERTGWVARGDGLLVRDINGDGVINNGGELFGSGTVLSNGQKAKDGYEAMRALDTNFDVILDSKDAAFSQLAAWADRNGDGITDAGELTKLSDLGITSLSLTSTASVEVNNGNLIGLMGSYTKSDGTTHVMGDVWFQTDSSGSRVFDLAEVAKAAGGSNINLTSTQAETLKVTLADVLAVGEADILQGTSSVTITGDSSDTVQLSGTWSYAGTQQDGADTYMVYVNQNAHLLVNDKIHTIIG